MVEEFIIVTRKEYSEDINKILLDIYDESVHGGFNLKNKMLISVFLFRFVDAEHLFKELGHKINSNSDFCFSLWCEFKKYDGVAEFAFNEVCRVASLLSIKIQDLCVVIDGNDDLYCAYSEGDREYFDPDRVEKFLAYAAALRQARG